MIQMLAWNCQDLGPALTVQKLGDITWSHDPSIVFLSETKQSNYRVSQIQRNLGFHHGETFDPIGSAGGLAIWWKQDVDINFLDCTANLLDAIITIRSDGTVFRASWFYGPPHAEAKEEFWELVKNLATNDDCPWICLGDFNEILNNDEKEGGIRHTWSHPRYLRNFMDYNGLIDVGFSGQKFTWENRRTGTELIRERLDRAIVNSHWLSFWPNTTVDHSSRVGSDHCPLIINPTPPQPKFKKQFKFEAFWFEEPECERIIQRSWGYGTSINPYVSWSIKLGHCRRALINWSNVTFPNNRVLIDALSLELSTIQANADLNRLREGDICLELNRLWDLEDSYWKQRSRLNWFTAGDRNTKYFHLSTIQRRLQNRVTKLILDDESIITGDGVIREEFEKFFSNLFTSVGTRDFSNALNVVGPVITEEQNVYLSSTFSVEEINVAAHQVGSLKAPGPDGFPGMFYHSFWDIVSPTVSQAATCFQQRDTPINHLNKTNITLIPKVLDPDSVNQFRPISLCNNSYKILSKVLANRLKSILPNLISEQQNAFVPGRQIQDSILIAHEAFHYLRIKRRTKKYELGLKVDMNKAYDRVEWDFLEAVLHKMGFHATWISLVMKCVTTVSFSVKLNGKQGAFFTPSRGLRQGDPLSPYLFLLVTEVLSLNLSKAVSGERLQGIKLSRNCSGLSHLFFADDSLYFLKATVSNCQSLKTILDDFCLASGQTINHDKSSLFFTSNTPSSLKTNIGCIFGIEASTTPGKYLGLPTHWGKSKKEALAYVRDRIKSKLEGWMYVFLSQAGKEVLIKAVAAAIPAYPMNCFRMPVTLCRAINSDIASFWWGKKKDSDNIHWQSWTKLCKAKELGGLGFRDLEAFNLALLAKQCWRIQKNPNSLWVRILKARYFNNCNFFQAKTGSRSSWAWSSILAGRSSIMSGVRWQVNSGNKIQVWEDSWLLNGSDGLLHPFPTSNRFTPLLVQDLIDQDTKSWKIDHIEPFIPPEEAAAIKEIHIGDPSIDDRMIWPLERSGMFTVKSGYHFIHKSLPNTSTTSSSHMVDKKVWKVIWNINTLPKVRHFLWRAITNSLPIGCSLYRRKVIQSPVCSICGQYEESIEHCLLLCPWTDYVWFGSRMGFRIPKHEIPTLDEWILHLSCVETPLGISNQHILSLFASFAWCIWKTRCNSVYKALPPSPIQTIHTANILLNEFQVSRSHHKRICPP